MILLLATLSHASCVPVMPEIWPPQGADAPRNVGIRAALTRGDCVPEALVVELRGPTPATAETELTGLLAYFEDLPDLEPGPYQVTLRDRARTFQVTSDFVVSDRIAEAPTPATVNSLLLTNFRLGDDTIQLSADVGIERLPTGHAASIEWGLDEIGWGPGFIIQSEPPLVGQLWHTLNLEEPLLEETCVDVVTLSESREVAREEHCATPTLGPGAEAGGCTSSSTTPGWLLLLAGALGVMVRRRW